MSVERVSPCVARRDVRVFHADLPNPIAQASARDVYCFQQFFLIIAGGGVDEEKNETLLEALEREMREEVGIEVANGAVKLLDDSGKGGSEKTLDSGEVVWCEMKFNVFEIELDEYADEITVNPGDDIVETLWAEKDKLKDLQLTPPSIELFNKLGYLD